MLDRDTASTHGIDAVPRILAAVVEITGMRFAPTARDGNAVDATRGARSTSTPVANSSART